jgi:isopentenyl-diphosphate delta-isomerase
VDIVLAEDVAARATTTGLERIRFEHVALPEIDLDQVDLSTDFLGRRLAAPILVSSMTGGPLHARAINEAIAIAAGRLGMAFAVGSQRVALEGRGDGGFGRELRSLAGSVPILANIGAAQLAQWDAARTASAAIDMIDADALIVHLNPLQEAVQAGGDRNWAGLLGRIEALARVCPRPLVVKEVGSGISSSLARRLFDAGVHVIDVAGAGGTSWAAVEGCRAASPRQRAVAEAFRDWGIPTATAVVAVRRACPAATVIASGGVRDGVDAAKALRLGADLVGQAAGALRAALDGPDALTDHFAAFIEQLRIVCFCTGSLDLAALRKAPLVEPVD